VLQDLKYRFTSANALFKLIYLNLVVFVLVNFLATLSYLFQSELFSIVSYLALPVSLKALLFKPWTILSYMFMHVEFFHILSNLIYLYFAGQIFLQYFNAKKLYSIYILGGLAGGISYLLAFNLFPVFNSYSSSHLMGASASVLAVLFAVATYVPNYKINLPFIGSIPIKYLAIVSVFIDIISIPESNPGGHIAHLGGALFGVYFISRLKKGKDLSIPFYNLVDSIASLFKKKHLKTVHKRTKTDDEFRAEKAGRSELINTILDKIAKSGYDSLSAKEKEYLFKNSKKM
jgi:membrane associated rhomboid family serine protease|tara:strand:- start:1111 stop:1977 length:867 start_codon:yes stop_codon:yes gene_type:complete